MKARNLMIGRRTGQCVVKKETIRIACDGTDVFDDYWTDSEVESQMGNETTYMNRMQALSMLSVKSNESTRLKDPSFLCSRNSMKGKSITFASSIPEDETLAIVATDTLDFSSEGQTSPEKGRMTLRDLSIQTSQIYNTPLIEKVSPPKKLPLQNKVNLNNAKFGTAKSAKRESRNRSFAGEKTWLDKSCNTINLSNKEQSIQTSQRYSSPQRQDKKAKDANAIAESNILHNVSEPFQNNKRRSSRNQSMVTHEDEKENNPKTDIFIPNSSPRKVFPDLQNTTVEISNKQTVSNNSKSSQNIIQNESNLSGARPEGSSTNYLICKENSPFNLQIVSPSEKELEKSVKSMQLQLSKNTHEQQFINDEISKVAATADENTGTTSANTVDGNHSRQDKSTTNTNSHSKPADQLNTEFTVDNFQKKGRKRKKLEENNAEDYSNEEEGKPLCRRSGRKRIPPLAYWRNERRLFRNTDAGNVTCIKFERGTDADCPPPKIIKNRNAQRKISNNLGHHFESTKKHISRSSKDQGSMINDCIWYKHFENISWSKPFTQNDGKKSYIISKTFSDQDKSFGFIEINSRRRKEEQYSPLFHIYFTIMRGQVEFSINKSVLKLKMYDTVIVPVNVPYSIYNPGESKALLSFCAQKQAFFHDPQK